MGEQPGWGRRGKIAELLGRPAGAVARGQIKAARAAGIAPTLYVELRVPTTTYIYDDDPDSPHPGRLLRTVDSPAYTGDDRALLAALDHYEASLCRCGVPRAVAWHSEMDGFYEPGDRYVCHACTAAQPEDKDGKRQPVIYGGVRDTRPASKGPLPPFVLGVTTTSD